ncbi:MAG: DUF4058 family protein [Aggregatilineales bacterium]
MVIHSLKNQFRGINPHLNSKLQQHGWAGFHMNNLADIQRLMQIQLLPQGYTADAETSLQIRRGDDIRKYPRADVLILDTDPIRAVQPGILTKVAPVQMASQTMALAEAIMMAEDDDYYAALVIYKRDEMDGDPVTWIELLSPGNKPRGGDYHQYRDKREALLATGIVFVEIDYLHESSPTFNHVKDYADFVRDTPETTAFPYRIAVFIPRPAFKEGSVMVYEFYTDTPLPMVEIPLSGADTFTFNFNAAYQKTFSEVMYGSKVDYSTLPVHFERYSLIDRTLIARRMLAIHTAHAAGADLEGDDFLEAEDVSLKDALEQMNLLL